ncbi:MAG: hypothetical protein SCARUB_03042 [Candidatus Scalindua rubra]|uniref:Uncharacterized protein n=1 Tax=Candidatus Scalindua rubra TaxID=1872076 RepID=A0A1E3X872_9BACT|nr:MAG: hypothetical protein SCARUB_03042 [Candidatus Scalindua rubra]
MKKFLFLQIFFIFLLLIFYEAPSYGQSEFSQYYNKGLEYYKQGKYDQAGKEFEKAIELKPNDVYALYGLGNTYYCKAKYDDAVKIYTKAVKVNPDYAKVHYSLSLAYSKLGMTREAEKEKAIFRKLTQGEKGGRKAKTRVKSSTRDLSKEKVIRTPKKTIPQREPAEALTKQKERTVREIQRAPATSRDDSRSIFQGYTEETAKAKPRVYVKKYSEKFKIKPLAYIKEKWSTSGINKILICAFGYIFATQMWLCVVAISGFIIWRIRKNI